MASIEKSTLSTNALILIATILGCAALKLLSDILTPLALAMFLVVMVDSFIRVMHSRFPRMPDWMALTIGIIGAFLLFALSAYVIADNAQRFAARLDEYAPRLNGILMRLAAVAHIQVPPTVDQLLVRANPMQYVRPALSGLSGFAGNAIFVMIYVGFIIASRHGFERKVVRLFPDRDRRHRAMEVFVRVRDGIESYLWIQTVTGLMIAVASWALMAVVGLDNAFFWAFLIFLLSYIPIIGAGIGIILPPVFALVQFPGFEQAIILVVGLYAITFVVGNMILPRMQAESMNIDPVVVLLSVGFWGYLWGMAGIFLSTPLTVMVMVILAQFDGSRWIAVMLSESGDPNRIRDPAGPDETIGEHKAERAAEAAAEAAAKPASLMQRAMRSVGLGR